MGDFNKHDVLWEGLSRLHLCDSSDPEELLAPPAREKLKLLLSPGTVTFIHRAHKTESTLDLVFASAELAECMINCTTGSMEGSDHFSVATAFDFSLNNSVSPPRP